MTARNFSWLGSSNQTNVVMVVRSGCRYRQAVRYEGPRRLSAAPAARTRPGYVNPMLIRGLFGYKIKMVTGYKGSSKSIFAMEQGESQMAAFNWLAWASKVPHWFKGDKPFARRGCPDRYFPRSRPAQIRADDQRTGHGATWTRKRSLHERLRSAGPRSCPAARCRPEVPSRHCAPPMTR